MVKQSQSGFLFLLLILFCISIDASAQLIDPQLKEPINHAIESNYALKNKTLDAEKTNAMAGTVKSKLLPEVSAMGGYAYFTNTGSIDVPETYLPIIGLPLFKGDQKFDMHGQAALLGVTATQVLFSGLQIPYAIKALQEKEKAEKLLIEADKESIAKEVVTTFDQIMLLDEVEKLIIDSEKRLSKENERINKAIANGLAIPYDRDKIKLALLELDSKKIELNGSRQLLLQKSKMLTHLPIEDIQKIKYPLKTIYLADIDFTIDNRKELQALTASSNALNYVLKKEKGASLPTVFAFGNASYTNIFNTNLGFKKVINNYDLNLKMNHSMLGNLILGVGAKWTIFNGGEHKFKVQQAKLDIDINDNKRLDAEEKLNLLLEKSRIDYQTAFEKIKVNEQQEVVAENNIVLASRRYLEGLISVTERLEAENDFYKSSLNLFTQIIEQRKTALELLHNSGSLLNQLLN